MWDMHQDGLLPVPLKPWEPGEPFDPLGPSVRKLGLLGAGLTGLNLLHGVGVQQVECLVKIQLGTFTVAALCCHSVLTQMSS